MKTAFLLSTLAVAAMAAPQQQFKVCTTDKDCNKDFWCRPTDDGKFSMCQPGSRPSSTTAAPGTGGKGKQYDVCTSNGDCAKGLFCKATNDKKFSMCQPNEGCSKQWQQCAGKSYSGSSCCENGGACKFVNEWYSQCVPASHAMASEASCTNVSVEGDATYCIQGAICGGAGDACPKKGDVAVADCIKTLKSYADGAKCVAPVDATCQVIKTGAKGCVFGAGAPAGTTAAPAGTTAAPAGTTAAPAGTTAAPSTSGQCAENHSQCNGQNWPFGVCCKDPNFVCNKKNDYLSLCEPKSQGKDAQAGEVAVWQQCGGNNYKGDTTCTTGNSCVKVNDWYHQCQPVATGSNQLSTWSQCAGSANNFNANGKTCRPEDKCVKYSDAYSQCVPQTQKMDAAAEMGCTNVSVEGDATYCIQGAICGGAGDACPKKGDVAVADCVKTLKSYADGAKCVAPVDATCQVIKTGAKGCVFGAGAPAGTTAAPAGTTAAPAGTTAAPSTSGQCAENHSQCNGQNWPFGVCCKDPNFVCNKKNDYLSLCEPKPKEMDAQVAEVAVWQQCGGNNYKGDTTCTTGNSCVKVNDWYHQCQPYSDAYSQCVPK
uniref:Secreted protein n=1 Tax=Achlya hypogyna TaxID=1202772 RepID=A0A0A7CNA0_ACHHY|nr:secreted protein [Achlya hypogyna]